MLDDPTFFTLARAAVRFANLPRIESAAQVGQLFSPWANVQPMPETAESVRAYAVDQALLRRALLNPPTLAKLVGKERHWLLGVPLVVTRNGFQLSLSEKSVPGVKTSWLLVVSELLTRQKPHIVECNLIDCPNLIFRELRVGRPSHYCPGHERAANRRGDAGKKQVITHLVAYRRRQRQWP